jgi:hypothetical protein
VLNLLLDVDDTLLDWSQPFTAWMTAQGYRPETLAAYSLQERYPRLTRQDLDDAVSEFAQSYEYRRLVPRPHARQTLETLLDLFPQTRLIAVSCCGLDGRTIDNRTWQLRSLPITALIPLPIGGSKREVFAEHGGVVVEDHPDHLNAARELGLRTIAFTMPWNESVRVTARFACWKNALPQFERVLRN